MSCALFGFHCPPNFHLVSGAARTATVRAQHALTIFDHLIELGREDSAGMGLHPVECWELATAVRYSSSLDDREFISSELGELGDLTREVKDSVIGLNAQGINAFVWIVHEFSRLEELITRAAQSSSHSSPRQQAELERLLNALFDKINTSLQDLLSALDKAVPTATLASDRGRRIFGALRAEESAKEKEWEEKGWAQWLRDAPGPKGRQLRRDLELTKASAEAVVGVWEALEGTRESLLSYRDNVGFFKVRSFLSPGLAVRSVHSARLTPPFRVFQAGVVGFHLSGHGLTVEEEMSSLQSVVGEMRTALAEARGRTGAWRSKRPNALPAPPKG
ncbi:SPOSA6832_03217, partial [Sporobolomyces salmonicolor]